MDKIFWILEYGKVFMAYIFLMFIWPSVVFRKLLKGKSLTFSFAFCITATISVMNTVVLLFGLLHILNKWTVCLFFYGLFLFSLLRRLPPDFKPVQTAKKLLGREYGLKIFFSRLFRGIENFFKQVCHNFWAIWRRHFWEYLMLFIVVAYGVIYFSWGVMHDYSYGFSDSYTHHMWTYDLTLGNIFSHGVYPEGMHCVVYTIYTLFGISLHTINLFLGCIHITAYILSAYCLFKELFGWRGSAVLAVLLFLIVRLGCLDTIYDYSRLQCTLPQEFGFFTIFLCPAFLVRYLKSNKHPIRGKRQTRLVWDENLIAFGLALADSLAIHFYVTIFAFFMCAGFALFSIRKLFRKTHFWPLVTAAALGVVLAVLPMAGALATGMRFQGSINWAMSVMTGSTGDSSVQHTQTDNADNIGTQGPTSEEDGDRTPADEDTSAENTLSSAEDIPTESTIKRLFSTVTGLLGRLVRSLRACIHILYREQANFYILLGILSCVLFAAYRIIVTPLKKALPDFNLSPAALDHYVPMIFTALLFLFLYVAPSFGLPELIQISRLCGTIHILLVTVITMPLDLLFYILSCFAAKNKMDLLNPFTVAAVYALVLLTGNYHGYLYFSLTRYNITVDLTEKIMREYPRYSYTIVSPNEELYHAIQDGRHEDLYQFMNQLRYESEYYLPTEYVFVYIEKKAFDYAQIHFFSGPAWLGQDTYDSVVPWIDGTTSSSHCPEISGVYISEESANDLYRATSAWPIYTHVENRTILESRAYRWCTNFVKLYTHEAEIYYEDEDFVCFKIHQNPQRLFNMVIQ